jgi:hypothetical protein
MLDFCLSSRKYEVQKIYDSETKYAIDCIVDKLQNCLTCYIAVIYVQTNVEGIGRSKWNFQYYQILAVDDLE